MLSLPQDMILSICSFLPAHDILISPYRGLMNDDILWKILFERDFKLHKHVINNYKIQYERLSSLVKLSKLFPFHYMQEETLQFISDKNCLNIVQDLVNDDLYNALHDGFIKLDDLEDYRDDLYEDCIDYLYNNMTDMSIINGECLYFKNGIVSNQKKDRHYGSMITNIITNINDNLEYVFGHETYKAFINNNELEKLYELIYTCNDGKVLKLLYSNHFKLDEIAIIMHGIFSPIRRYTKEQYDNAMRVINNRHL